MRSRLLRLTIAVVRAWTRLYTCRMPTPLRDARRAEIDSDLWELAHDPAAPPRVTGALHVLLRMLAGIPDDLGWRVDLAADGAKPMTRRLILSATAAAFVAAALWVLSAMLPVKLPIPPSAPKDVRVRVPAPPPPPPPPPPSSRLPIPPSAPNDVGMGVSPPPPPPPPSSLRR